MLKALSISALFIMAGVSGLHGQMGQIRIEPPNWWAGMQNPSLQLMLQGHDLAYYTPRVDYGGLELDSWHPGSSRNYLFLDLTLDPGIAPGTVRLLLQRKGHPEISMTYELKQREKAGEEFVGFDASDVVYLITPDRFANGDPQNDVIPSMKERRVDRGDDYARHG